MEEEVEESRHIYVVTSSQNMSFLLSPPWEKIWEFSIGKRLHTNENCEAIGDERDEGGLEDER